MKRILLNNTEYILTRERGGVRELVSLDGELLSVPVGTTITPLEGKPRPLTPLEVPFQNRPRSFITDLHQSRLKWLLEAGTRRKGKKLDKSLVEDGVDGKKPKGKGKGKKGPSLAEQLALLGKGTT